MPKLKSVSPTVDVVIPTFNSQNFILEAINSCLGQSHPVNKIIIVDDGSESGFKEFLRDLSENNNRLEIIFNSHTGLPGVGRQIGIRASNAEWIAFLDSDDYWAPNKIDLQLEQAVDSQVDLIYTNGWIVTSTKEIVDFHTALPKEITFDELLKTNWLINSSVLVRREILGAGDIYATSPRVRAVEDFATWLRLSTRHKFLGIDLPLVYYREHDASIRNEDFEDPRIHAIADFIEWAHGKGHDDRNEMNKFKKLALKSLKNQYLAKNRE